MSKKPTQPQAEPFITQQITETLETNYMPYAMSVIVSRAIPEIDGFKPSHRKLLYTMYNMGLLKGGRIKSADVVGQTMRLNPHGDAAIYETLVRLTRGNAALLHPFIDSKGNFGKQYSRDMAYAASRYTEVKLDSICAELFENIDKDSVDFIDNYNGTMKEPVLFPSTFPNVLVTPNYGIAVGMASSICSFNLKEVCDAAIAFIKDESCDILQFLSAPDFSTGGEFIYEEAEIKQIYETGRGSFKLRAKYRFDKKHSCIEIYEIPYSTTIEVIVDKIAALVKQNKIRDINDVRDETDLNGLKIAIDIKRGADADVIMQRLYSMTTLSDSMSANFNVLIAGKPMTLGVKGLLREWLKFRMQCVKRYIAYDIKRKEEKLHLLTGLSKILLDIDKAIRIVRETEEDSQVIPNLMTGFDIDKLQAEYVAEIKLRNLNKQYILNRISELDGLKAEIDSLKQTLGSDAAIKSLISKQLKEIAKKYGVPRKTDIIHIIAKESVPEHVFIEDYGLKLFLTEQNYFKKISLVSLRTSGEQNVKEGDKVIQELEATNKSDILFFSDKCTVYKLKAYEVSDCKASSMGEYLTNMLGMVVDERVVKITTTTDYSGFMLFVFKNGKIAKIPMSSYATKVNRKKLINAYGGASPLVFAEHIAGDLDVLLVRDSDKAALLNTGLIPEKVTRSSGGVQVYTLKRGSNISKFCLAETAVLENIELYRIGKIPSTGHFLADIDKSALSFDVNIGLWDI
ncbi:MAG: DNA topoisomerase (ATP-hydrolyzing) subunit A [Defluviitaleaceae bacterium]|nr:DNA topoisomerase (ATP-hydrolyzing) subunit A [Defluviitaleaceae bacterium]